MNKILGLCCVTILERKVCISINEMDVKIEISGNLLAKDLMALVIFGIYFCVPEATFEIGSLTKNDEVFYLYVCQNDLCENIKKSDKRQFANALCDSMNICYKFTKGTEFKTIFKQKYYKFIKSSEGRRKKVNWDAEIEFSAP